MERRGFLTAACSVAAVWPARVLAQRSSLPVLGFLNTDSARQRAVLVEAFHRGLAEGGYVDGKQVVIEYRWAEGQLERLPALAADLAERQVALIVATGGNASALAAKAATSTIPVIFALGGDPVKLGLVASLSRPGANVTGVTNMGISLEPKRLELLRELVPAAARIAFLVNPRNPGAKATAKEVETAGDAMRTKVQTVNASSLAGLDAAFAAMKKGHADALLVANDALFLNQRERLVALAAQHSIPAIYAFAEFASTGGLISYGADRLDQYRQLGFYASRVLKGTKPADLPVLQATKFELIINLKTARDLGLTVPPALVARADKLIE